MTIDINTLFVAIILTGLLIATVLTIVGTGVDNSLLYWATGYAINSMAFVLLASRGAIPDLFSVLLANILIASAYAFYAYGLFRFLKKTMHPLVLWGPVFVVAILFPFFSDNVAARILIIGIVNAYQSLLILYFLVRNTERLTGRGKYILAAAFAAGGVIALSRPFALVTNLVEITAINSAGGFQSLTFLTMLLINCAIALGLVLMLREQAEHAISTMARTDDLTALPNRRDIYEQINKALTRTKKNHLFGALILIDLDNFKTINDKYGHDIGDKLLRQAANRICAALTSKDAAARLGGDEFVVLLKNLSDKPDSARAIAIERVTQLHKNLDTDYEIDDLTIHGCTGSIGLALFEPGKHNREELLREADQAMYRVKLGQSAVRA